MIPYSAPLKDQIFNLQHVIGLERLQKLEGCDEVSLDLVEAVFEEAGKIASEVLAPINFSGDKEGSKLVDGEVKTPKGFKEAYKKFAEAGWCGLPHDEEYGGQYLPWSLAFCLQEIWNAANMSFALCPMLSGAAVEAIEQYGTDEQKKLYLEQIISGNWTGSMNLTEPQAGTDLAQINCRAEKQDDGTYLIKGQKIFITYGNHDFTENIIHMVLARTPDAPMGVKGISMFIVPNKMVNDDGTLGEKNDIKSVSLEHKLGIHASPTAVMSYGDEDNCKGFLIGEENKGLIYMFTMMNSARLAVGIQGIGIADRAYQQARDYANERVQSEPLKPVEGIEAGKATIIYHPDIRRMLMTMKSKIEAGRALYAEAAYRQDCAKRLEAGSDKQKKAAAFVDLLTPIIKGWSTELGTEAASLGIQIHGGMGFIEETGAAQHYRDARIAQIYEGTNGIQANDLLFRKLLRDDGAIVRSYLRKMGKIDNELAQFPDDDMGAIRAALTQSIGHLKDANQWLLAMGKKDIEKAAAGAFTYMMLFGNVAGGYMLARAALAAKMQLEESKGDSQFNEAKINTARFYAENILPQCRGMVPQITQGYKSLFEINIEEL